MKIKQFLLTSILVASSLSLIPKLSVAEPSVFNRSGNYLVWVGNKITGQRIKNPSDYRRTVYLSADVEFVLMRRWRHIVTGDYRYEESGGYTKSRFYTMKPDEEIVLKFRPEKTGKKVNLSVEFK